MLSHRAMSLIEVLIVLAIIGALLGLLFPAVQSARVKAREAVCKNNLHQLEVATTNYWGTHKKLPDKVLSGTVGGWTLQILPFLEETILEEDVTYGVLVSEVPDFLLQPPRIYRCPEREVLVDAQDSGMHSSDYILERRSESFSLYDAPLETKIPWVSGPEMSEAEILKLTGPHHGGFFYTGGWSGGKRSINFVESNNAP